MIKWLAICTPSIVVHLEVHRQCLCKEVTHLHTGRTVTDSRSAPVLSVQCSGLYRHLRERAWDRRGIARRKRAPVRRHSALLLLRTPRAICTSSNDSITEESRRFREKSVSSGGKVRSYTSLLGFFNRILLGRVRTLAHLRFRVFDSFSSLFFRLMHWTDSSAARRDSLCVL